MSRKKRAPKKIPVVDPKFKSSIIPKLVNSIMYDGKKTTAEKIVYDALNKIKSKLGTLGHSDGDPVLHSVTDAILGACKMGDIGQMFSDKSKKFKNVRSTILLNQVIERINSKGFFINNIDINIISQTPRIKSLKNKMISNIAKNVITMILKDYLYYIFLHIICQG